MSSDLKYHFSFVYVRSSNFSNLGPVLQIPDVFDSKNIQNIRVDSQSQISLNNIYKSYNIETLRIFDYCSGMPNDNVSVLQ